MLLFTLDGRAVLFSVLITASVSGAKAASVRQKQPFIKTFGTQGKPGAE